VVCVFSGRFYNVCRKNLANFTLKEEKKEEGLLRDIGAFARFYEACQAADDSTTQVSSV